MGMQSYACSLTIVLNDCENNYRISADTFSVLERAYYPLSDLTASAQIKAMFSSKCWAKDQDNYYAKKE